MLVTILIPTIGSHHLVDAVRSAMSQVYDVSILVMVDGSQYKDKVHSLIGDIDDPRLSIMVIPSNTGSGRRYGHHKYAAAPFLVNTDYVSFLDEDNTYDPDHIDECMKIATPDVAMVYTYRKIIREDGTYVCNDTFESVGDTKGGGFCDTNTMVVRTDIACKYAYMWVVKEYSGEDGCGSDRIFSTSILNREKCVCTMGYTINYRTDDSKPNSPAFFLSNM